MEIFVQVRHNHHQVIPTFECKATNWEEANRQLTNGLHLIRNKNQYYLDRFESYNALICGIMDFVLTDEQGTISGQFGFSIDIMDKSIKELVEWYVTQRAVKKIG